MRMIKCVLILQDTLFWKLFPTAHRPPQNLNDRIMCLRWLSKSQHIFQVYLKPGCPIPLISMEWTTHSITKVETWSDQFVERMQEFTKLRDIERESNVHKSKRDHPYL